MVVRDQLRVIEAARVGARAAAVSPDPASSGSTAASRALDGDGSVQVTVVGDVVTVRVLLNNPTDVPLIGAMLPGIDIAATATMILEPP